MHKKAAHGCVFAYTCDEAVMNWDDVRIFLAIQRAGTLRGAAQELAIDQTTVSRRLTGLERALGSRLFLRTTGAWR
ncbi:LysR family transcriptional regulator [Achromobacter xylosoxidans]